MHAKIVTVNISGDRHGLKAADKVLVDFLVVELLEDFGPEGEMLGHRT